MKRQILAMAVIMMAGCVDDLPEAPEAADAVESALITDPWQGIYAVRQSSTNRFIVNPLGSMQITCYDGIRNLECPVQRLSLSGTGLPSSRQQEIRNRLPSEPPDERMASMLLKGTIVNVRDHGTVPPTYYPEFRATAAYLAPTVRNHGGGFAWVESGPQNGFQTTRLLNTDLTPERDVSFPHSTRLLWVGPGSAPSYPPDSFVAYRAVRVIGPGLAPPLEMDVDQRFVRVMPGPFPIGPAELLVR